MNTSFKVLNMVVAGSLIFAGVTSFIAEYPGSKYSEQSIVELHQEWIEAKNQKEILTKELTKATEEYSQARLLANEVMSKKKLEVLSVNYESIEPSH